MATTFGIWLGVALPFIIGIIVLLVLIFVFWKSIRQVLNLRTVVATNMVHINQSAQGTAAYGRGLDNGNVYYRFPQWIPKIGISTIEMPTSIFDIELSDYDAYDKGRLPFTVDIKAFFKVDKAETAAQRVASFQELKQQLSDILKGSVRTILGGAEIEAILGERGIFGDQFTKEVKEQLEAWGVDTVKNIEFMDIRDSEGSKVIANIMAKKKSEIEMESRMEVAENNKKAKLKEIDAKREADVQEQDALLQVGEKEAEKEKKIGIANEMAQQEIREAAKVTAEKDMAVKKVEEEKRAEIDKNVAEIDAQKKKGIIVIAAEADAEKAEKQKQQKTYEAEAALVEEEKRAAGIKAVGDAEAAATTAMELAPVTAQIALAKEIGENDGYQKYLLGLEEIAANLEVGREKAQALKDSDIKIIANTGSPEEGFDSLMDVFTSKGGTKLGGMLEAIKNTDMGKSLFEKVGITDISKEGDVLKNPQNNSAPKSETTSE